MKSFLGLLVPFFGLLMTSLAFAKKQSADVIFVNGDICTGMISFLTFGGKNSISGAMEGQRVQALAVAEARIAAAGSNDEILKLKGPKTQVIDLGGHFVMPGFNDAHTHLASAGFE